MKKIYLVIFLTLTSSLSMPAATFQEAAEAYKNQNYTEAATIYEAIIKKDGISSEIYYNLGNAYYKSKQYPKAILNYERGLLLSPGDEDIRVNLDMARTKITDKIDTMERSFISIWIESLRNIFSSDVWSVIGIATFLLFLVGIYLYFFTKNLWVKKLGFFGGVILLLISVISNRFAYQQKEKIITRNEAIIMTPSITVKSSPAESGTDIFILHEGAKIKVTDKVGEWSEISIEDGNSGWIPTSKMEVI
ncbi:MAG: tetratricopeptide repeat protein [Bacteroidales bacterium]